MPLRTLWLEVDILSSDESFGLPKMLLPAALRHQHVDYLNARRVQTLMHLHGSEGHQSDPSTTILRWSISMLWSQRRSRAHKPMLRKLGE
jgi:hypothetical protein